MLILWEFQRLPESKFDEVIQNYESLNVAELARIYREHQIGPSNLSDCCAVVAIMMQTKEAIEKNFKRDVTNQAT